MKKEYNEKVLKLLKRKQEEITAADKFIEGQDYEGLLTDLEKQAQEMIYQCQCIRSQQSLDSAPTKEERILTKAKFYIEDSNISYKGYTYGIHWNGWECPYFKKEEALKIAEKCDLEPNKAYYDEAQDAFVFEWKDSEREPDVFKGMDIQYNAEVIHVYAIGAYSWIWEKQ